MKAALKAKASFANEAALCAAFISALPEGWTAYPETAGFDILLVRGVDGAQIGVEAKMTLNAKVLLQSVEGMYSRWEAERSGPDFRAALVPYGTAGAEMKSIAHYLGVTVLECRESVNFEAEIEKAYSRYTIGNPDEQQAAIYRKWAEADVKRDWRPFSPELPAHGDRYRWGADWTDHCPPKRCKVPEYVPDVAAGVSGPSSLSDWKIKAIKICVLLEKRGSVTIADFKHLQIDRRRWLDMRWLKLSDERGRYIAGLRPLDLRAAHPVNFLQIEADYEKWAPKEEAPALEVLL